MKFIKGLKNVWNLAAMCGNDVPMHDMLKHLDFFGFSGNGCDRGFCVDLKSCQGIDRAYYDCSPLSTVIGRNAMAMSNAKWWIVDSDDNDRGDKYKQITKLLKNPNPIQSWTEFMIQLDTYRQLYGEVFVYAAVPVGYSIQEASALWAIKPDYIEVEQTNRLYHQSNINDIVAKYYLHIDGNRTKLDNDKLLHIKDTFQNLNFCPTNIRGKSRMGGLEDHVRNIIQANEAIYSLNTDRGAQGILSNDTKDKIGSLPVTPIEKDTIQKAYNENYGLLKKQWKVILTDASLRWQQMTFNVKDLMLFEGIEENIKRISEAFGYPYELLGNVNGVTFANKKEAKSWHYQDIIIPIAQIYSEKFTQFFGLEKDRIYADFDHIEVLKESESEKAITIQRKIDAYSKAYQDGAISLEEYRLGLGYDEVITGTTMYNNNTNERGIITE